MSAWATEQALLLEPILRDKEDQAGVAEIVWLFGGSTGPLVVASCAEGWLTEEDIAAWALDKSEILLVQDAAIAIERRDYGDFELGPNVLIVATGVPGVLQTREWIDWPDDVVDDGPGMAKSLSRLAINAVAVSWSLGLAAMATQGQFSTDHVDVQATIGVRDGQAVVADHLDILRRAVG